MKVTQIIAESSKKPVSEAPTSRIAQFGRKLGAKALAKVGAKDTAMGMAGKIDTGDEANQLRSEFQNHVGSIGGNMKAIDPTELKNWLLSKKFEKGVIDAGFTAGGIKTEPFGKGPLDKALLAIVQNSKKAQAPKDDKTQPEQPVDKTQPQNTKTQDAKPTKPIQGQGNQQGQGDQQGSGIPADIQAQLDQLTDSDKKYVMAGL